MNIPPSETQADDDPSLPPARRRQTRRRLLGPLEGDERSQMLERVARRAAPSFDFFLYSLLSGIVVGFGIALDSPYLTLLGIFFAPVMAPAIGISLSTAIGSTRHFFRSFGGFLLGSALTVVSGWAVGIGSQIWAFGEASQAHVFAQLRWPPFLLLGMAGVLASATFVKERKGARASSLLLAYGLYLPLVTAGFGLGSGQPYLWPDGLVIFAIHLAWTTLLGATGLFIMGFRPISLFGYSLGAVVALGGILVLIGFGGAGAVVGAQLGLPTASPSPSLTPSATFTPSATSSLTPTLTPSRTPTRTPTPTQTATSTAQAARILAVEGSGAFVRAEPAGLVITSLLNGERVELLDDAPVSAGGQLWLHVFIPSKDLDGWILQELMVTTTPAPSITPSPSETPAS